MQINISNIYQGLQSNYLFKHNFLVRSRTIVNILYNESEGNKSYDAKINPFWPLSWRPNDSCFHPLSPSLLWLVIRKSICEIYFDLLASRKKHFYSFIYKINLDHPLNYICKTDTLADPLWDSNWPPPPSASYDLWMFNIWYNDTCILISHSFYCQYCCWKTSLTFTLH